MATIIERRPVDRIWLKSYAPGVPPEADVDAYANIREILETSCRKFERLPAFTCMGATIDYAALDRLSMRFGSWLQNVAGLKKDDRVRWFISSANRDPSMFEKPDRFDINRWPNQHVAFGSGIHHCLGATLARVEGQEVFKALAERFPGFRLDNERLEYQPSITFRSLKSLPINWQ